MELVHLSRGAIPQPSLGASLRAARLGRNITLEAVAAHTKINAGFFRDLERDDLSKWPANQFYRESYLRAYADAVGLDPAEVIDGYRHEFMSAGTSGTAASTTTRRRLTPVTIPIILAITFVTVYSLARWMTSIQGEAPAGTSASAARPAAIESAGPPATDNNVPTTEPAAPASDEPATVDVDQIEGELIITSTPPGARVLVNGIGRGPTPARVRFLPPGSYTVRLLLPGYTAAMRNVDITPRRLRVRVSATLEPAPLPRARGPAESSAPVVD